MGNIVVRLSSLTLKNIKNVKNGIIIMPLANERKFECSRAEILGIYDKMDLVKQQLSMHFIFYKVLLLVRN